MKHGDRRKAQILKAGLQLWRNEQVAPTARSIAKALGMTHTTILYHFKDTDNLKQALAGYAVQTRDPVIVPMLIAARNTAAATLTEQEKSAFLSAI